MDSKLFDPQLIIEIFRRNVTEHYFDMNGRVSRAEFWLFVLACVVVTLIASIVGSIVGFGGLLGAVANLALLLPLAGIGARRLQDTGKNGGMVWLFVLPTGINLLINAWFYLTISSVFGWYGSVYYGWYWPVRLLSLIGLIAGIYIAYLCAQPGTSGQNAFGPEPAKPVAPAPKTAT
jgi:uncharacterized membrane protein YhaH (DUF805 family)